MKPRWTCTRILGTELERNSSWSDTPHLLLKSGGGDVTAWTHDLWTVQSWLSAPTHPNPAKLRRRHFTGHMDPAKGTQEGFKKNVSLSKGHIFYGPNCTTVVSLVTYSICTSKIVPQIYPTDWSIFLELSRQFSLLLEIRIPKMTL